MNLKYSFLPPVYSDLETTQKASFLHYTFLVIAVAFLAFGILNLGWGATSLGVTLLVFSGICLIGFYLNKAKRYYPAAILLTVIIYIGIFFNLIDGAAFHDPGVAALPIFVILTGILFRKTQIPILTILTILGLTAIYYFWSSDLLVLNKPPTQGRLMILSIIQVVSGALTWMIISAQSEIIGELDLSEERFQSLFMAAPIGIGVTSRDGSVLVYNESLIRMGGWNPDEFKQLNVQDYYANPQDRIKMLSILEAAGVVRGYETQFFRKDKGIFDVSMSVIPLKYGDEDGFLTIIEDISNRKQAELERQEELEFRRLLVDASPIFFTVVNRKGQTTMMNRSMVKAIGYEWEEILEADYIKTFVPEREQSAVLKAIEEVFEHNKTILYENHILTKASQELLVEWHTCPIINSEEKIEFIFAYGVDITERKKGEIEIKESEERYRSLIDNMPIPFVIHADEKVLFMNPMGLKTMGISDLEDIIGRSIWKYIHPKSEEKVIQNLEITYEQRRATDQTQAKFIRLNGESFDVESVGIPLMYDGQQAVQTIFQDITERKQAERELRESEEKFQKVFMKSPYSMTIARIVDGVYVEVNEGFVNTVGYTREEAIGLSAVELGLVKDRKALENRDRILATEGGTRDIEMNIMRKDGQEIISLVSSEVMILNGEPHRLSVGKNITDLRESERALQDSDTRNRLILQSLPMAFYRALPFDKYGGTWVSEQIDQIVGFSPEDMVDPEFWSSRLHPDDRDFAIQAFDNLGETTSLEIEYRWQKEDGDYLWIQDNAAIITDDEGNPTEIIGTWIDITERKNAEQSLRESEEHYRTVFENAVEGISIHAGDKFIDINKTWLEMFGYSKEEVLGKSPFDFSPKQQNDGRDSNVKGRDLINLARTGQEQKFEWRHTRADGTEFDAEIFMTIFKLSGEEMMISFVRDLTERKRAQAATLEERQRLAHELHDAVSQTLFSASMIAQTLERSWEKDPNLVRENLKELQILTQGALAEMRNLLLELRPGALKHTPMPELLHQLVEGFSGRTKTDIELDITGDLPLKFEVRFVFFRLAQEALNNIIKHARAKIVTVTFNSQPEQVQLRITDDGRGFTPTNTQTGHHGLEIMKERAESINANLVVKSQTGQGTTVHLIWQPKEAA